LADITLHTAVYGYQKRLWWFLSSLLEQVAKGDAKVPLFKIHIDTHAQDPWKEWNKKIWDVFGETKLIPITMKEWNDDSFGLRAVVRQATMEVCDTPWLLFLDPDMVFSPESLASLWIRLSGEYANEHKVVGCGRFSQWVPDETEALLAMEDHTIPIKNAFGKVKTILPNVYRKGGWGVGFFQAINVPNYIAFRKTQDGDIRYVNKGYENRDANILNRNASTKTDRAFRIRAGGVVSLSHTPGLEIIHLQHPRTGAEKPLR
jgi:hypothetical protein